MPRARSSATAAARRSPRHRRRPAPRLPAQSAALRIRRRRSSAPTAAKHSPAEAQRHQPSEPVATFRPGGDAGAIDHPDEPAAGVCPGWWRPGLRRRRRWIWWRRRLLRWGRRLRRRRLTPAFSLLWRRRGRVLLLSLHRLRPLAGLPSDERAQSDAGVELGPGLCPDGADAIDADRRPGGIAGEGPELQPADVPRPGAGGLLCPAEGLDGSQPRARPRVYVRRHLPPLEDPDRCHDRGAQKEYAR